jgi:deoxyribonuclease V
MLRGKFTVERARRLQRELAAQVIKEDKLPKTIRFVAGVDVSYAGNWAFGAVAVLDYGSLAVAETRTAKVKTSFPYVPTFLSFREIKPSLAAIRKLKMQPDVFVVDAQGIAHPYRLGFASHLGLLLGKPSVGVAKSLLCGQVQRAKREGWSPIIDKGETLGAEIRREETEKPIYVSIGHKVNLERAIEIAEHCTLAGRLPEPIRIAHMLATEEMKKHKQEITHES